MLVLIGKAAPDTQTGDVEVNLSAFRAMLASKGAFVYAWSFNPDEAAMEWLREQVRRGEKIYLYLPYDGRRAQLRMRVCNFYHRRRGVAMCPYSWQRYCIESLQGEQKWGVHLWFLMDQIEELPEPVDLLSAFTPVFEDKYRNWGQNYFAFLQGS